MCVCKGRTCYDKKIVYTLDMCAQPAPQLRACARATAAPLRFSLLRDASRSDVFGRDRTRSKIRPYFTHFTFVGGESGLYASRETECRGHE